MRSVALAMAILSAGALTVHAQSRPPIGPGLRLPPPLETADERLDRLERWLNAVERHQPGVADAEATAIGAWSTPTLQGLWIDFMNMAAVMRNPKAVRFEVQSPDKETTRIIYSNGQLGRLRATARQAIRDNGFLKRAALLHSDIAILIAPTHLQPGDALPVGPTRVRLRFRDGMSAGVDMSGLHWEIAETILDEDIKTAPAGAAATAASDFVRQWYGATSAWMQWHEQYDSRHFERGLALFPDDLILLFLSGTEHEIYAMPEVQASVRNQRARVGLPRSFFDSPNDEWERAAAFFRKAVAKHPSFAEARLRHGHVLSAMGRNDEAAAELRTALSALDDETLRYYGEMFLGHAEEMLGHYQAARDAFGRAQALFPRAQKPRLAISQIEFRLNRRQTALEAIEPLFEPEQDPDGDPWTTYHIWQARGADDRIHAVWSLVPAGAP